MSPAEAMQTPAAVPGASVPGRSLGGDDRLVYEKLEWHQHNRGDPKVRMKAIAGYPYTLPGRMEGAVRGIGWAFLEGFRSCQKNPYSAVPTCSCRSLCMREDETSEQHGRRVKDTDEELVDPFASKS